MKRLHFDEKLANLLKKGGVDDNISERKAFGIKASQQVLQILALFSCFQLALYVMTVAYNIQAEGMNALWHLVSIDISLTQGGARPLSAGIDRF